MVTSVYQITIMMKFIFALFFVFSSISCHEIIQQVHEEPIPVSPQQLAADSVDFDCTGRSAGYYADVSQECKVYHVCTPTESETIRHSFNCPEGTAFDQTTFTCDFITKVACQVDQF
ncbi:U-scoloptoxin(01)-Cw1a-like [Panonychus citri]|uniref:U-scoloptoxin(01)-Cw1a-like n=1 Tax=Panonychus citri TaxID=50023 RepID=UPI0023078A65|nr:U-scoloptoxin(01)-Cw1a-like [Panonychus citri]